MIKKIIIISRMLLVCHSTYSCENVVWQSVSVTRSMVHDLKYGLCKERNKQKKSCIANASKANHAKCKEKSYEKKDDQKTNNSPKSLNNSKAKNSNSKQENKPLNKFPKNKKFKMPEVKKHFDYTRLQYLY